MAVIPNFVRAIMSMVGIGLVIGLLFVLYIGFLRLITHWKTLAGKFPTTDVHLLGQKYPKQDGFFGNIRGCLSGQFEVELAEEGLMVRPWFAKGSTIFIHWHDIRDVSVDDSHGAIWTVNYETELKFTIPTSVLTVIQEKVPAERFHKAPSLLDLLKNRMAGR